MDSYSGQIRQIKLSTSMLPKLCWKVDDRVAIMASKYKISILEMCYIMKIKFSKSTILFVPQISKCKYTFEIWVCVSRSLYYCFGYFCNPHLIKRMLYASPFYICVVWFFISSEQTITYSKKQGEERWLRMDKYNRHSHRWILRKRKNENGIKL